MCPPDVLPPPPPLARFPAPPRPSRESFSAAILVRGGPAVTGTKGGRAVSGPVPFDMLSRLVLRAGGSGGALFPWGGRGAVLAESRTDALSAALPSAPAVLRNSAPPATVG